MLALHDVTKAYRTATLTQTALDAVSVSFRDNELVAVLGQSGSGKTTMLNVIGGLDHFDSGDLVIDGISTRDYKDRDWDAYRNNRIGFVFQAYNLIPHQSVLANVELALTLSGVPRAQRRERALAALDSVGLADHVHKRPSQLSGGQMQRVAIARALVNDPEILLADEPTGALDSATSVQVMDLLRQVAADRLVIMVTHNPELAHEYATRIVELADGRVVADSDPYEAAAEDAREAKEVRRTRMGALTALSLSFNNLMTKKGRTIMTSFAGSIGIIGIALILALANGVNGYIARTEEEALTSYPLSIQSTGMDLAGLMRAGEGERAEAKDGEILMTEGVTSTMESTTANDLASLKTFLDSAGSGVAEHVAAIEYSYDVTPQIYLTDTSDGAVRVSPDQAMSPMTSAMGDSPLSAMTSFDAFHQLPETSALYEDQYDVVAGHWPRSASELVVVTSQRGTLDNLYEYTLGLRPHAELQSMMTDFMAGRAVQIGAGSAGASPTAASTAGADGAGSPTPSAGLSAAATATGEPAVRTYSYADVLGRTFSLVPASARYAYDAEHRVWTDRSDQAEVMRQAVAAGQQLRVVGVVRAKDDTTTLHPGVAYTPELTRQVVREAAGSQIVRSQLDHPDTDVFTGRTFAELAQGAGAGELDMSSLFTIDGERLKAAFQIDPSALQADLTGLDLGSLSLPDLDAGALDLSEVDLSGLDLGALADQVDLSGLDVSDLDLADLATRYPQLGQIDYGAVVASALEDGVIKDGAGQYLAGVAGSLLQGFTDYVASQPGEDSDGDGAPERDWARLAQAYLAQPEVSEQLAQAAGSDQVIDSALLTQRLIEALGKDPSVEEIASQVSADLAGAVASQVGSQLASSLEASVGGAMTQMMTSLQTQVAAQLSSAMEGLAASLASAVSVDGSALAQAFQPTMDQDDLAALLATLMTTTVPTYEGNLALLGWAEESRPSQIDIYPTSFADKDAVKTILDDYNDRAAAAGQDAKVITYTDLVGTLMSSVTRIVTIITWMLIAFVAISLVVSSIMIAIITYISVLERKKEIGILRAIGASKSDVRHVFNAETVIEGLIAGLMGVGITLLVSLPVNAFVQARFHVYPIAHLSATAGAVLVAISVGLTLVAGILPSGRAAKEDPVEALRAE
ncbi:ABC transporter ATP-binding protein/permease [Actinomyces faecalis]|uniref:ABC transporter ATP-binding protein/permease n=1 Tax=Actinomyces faecalis TaxID=2722820 RepID=UPI00155412A2|nr:ABC transporter ATP-binding protein/permease [Actinomyces faecalis]